MENTENVECHIICWMKVGLLNNCKVYITDNITTRCMKLISESVLKLIKGSLYNTFSLKIGYYCFTTFKLQEKLLGNKYWQTYHFISLLYFEVSFTMYLIPRNIATRFYLYENKYYFVSWDMINTHFLFSLFISFSILDLVL